MRSSSPQWARRYPPLLAVAVAMVIAIGVLPSSLNLPQANPATTLEYAPVPPDDENPPPPDTGNLSQLGLAGSSSLERSFATTTTLFDDDLPGAIDNPKGQEKTDTDKECVVHDDGKARQTEDPLAPPCAARFDGDNFGATYQGVDKEEVQILFYLEGYIRYTTCSRGSESTPDGKYFDLGLEAEPDEHCIVRMLRGWQDYFNNRYQTYGRYVRFHAFFATGGLHPSAASRKADAADNYSRIKPFAVLSYAQENNDAYLESMARRGVLNFGALVGRENAFFQKFPKLVWGYYPALEYQAKLYSGFVCSKVVNKPAVAGSSAGSPRRLGLWSTSDENRPELIKLRELVKKQIEDCGGTFVETQTFPKAQYVQDNSTTPEYAAQASAAFQTAGVTTLIWPGGLETQLGKSSGNWRPEIIAAGDLFLDGNGEGQYQNAEFWSNAWMITNVTWNPELERSYCYQAYTQADPDAVRQDLKAVGCDFYNDIRQLFTGIQVAGPRLGPTSIDEGFHAIPRIVSDDPQVPSCYFLPGDYTCTKDATVEWWDPSGTHPNNQRNPGCWRMFEGGKRYVVDTWPNTNLNVPAKDRTTNQCNGFNGNGLINPNPPSVA